jgi:ABC-2 type transport system ATP-binding protein
MSKSSEIVIDVKGLTKRFGEKTVVDRVDLQVKKGEIYGFLGPNGSGKTTTIRMICGLLTADEGTGICLGLDVIQDAVSIRTQVGYMTQKFTLYQDLTVAENLDFIARMFGVKNRKAAVNKAIEALGIGKARAKQLAGNLSGGWKQRLALACATIHSPKLLLLDEPTAGVDPKARREFWDAIRKLSKQGVTTLVSTHYMDEAEQCDRLAYIAYGKMLTHGTADEVIDEAGLHMFTVKGEGMLEWIDPFKQEAAFEQVSAFGQALHVSGKDLTAMKKTIKTYTQKSMTWKQSRPTLEDVFIHFMSESEDNFA